MLCYIFIELNHESLLCSAFWIKTIFVQTRQSQTRGLRARYIYEAREQLKKWQNYKFWSNLASLRTFLGNCDPQKLFLLNRGCHLTFTKAKSALCGLFWNSFLEIKGFGHLAFSWPFLNLEENSIFLGLFWQNFNKTYNILWYFNFFKYIF